ncbi:MAG: histidine--tRNA ligase [Rhodanobacteraceae bacterium]
MSPTQARTMPGVLELLPPEQIAFQRMLDTIRRNFERFGFLPVETPVMEFSRILLTKQGGETERQVYFVQSTGALSAAKDAEELPELALRFDLTVPLARYVAEHERELNFPFRRYQIQRVYRGERAQRGRFREFYQCDIDVIGKDELSIRYDAEIPAVIYSVFNELGIGPFVIQLNNRKLMRGYFESLGVVGADQQTQVLREVDKLDKRGIDHVRSQLTGDAFGLNATAADRILDFVALRSTSLHDALDRLDEFPAGNAIFEQGRQELREVLGLLRAFGVPESHFALNLSIARGLDYYTGTVYETHLVNQPQIGSICSGGRYENLAGHYTKSHLPGVGISIGATRLFWQLRDAGLLGRSLSTVAVLIAQLDEEHMADYLAIANELRAAGINTEIVLEPLKLAKQFKYADRAGIRFVLVLGPDEITRGVVTIKDLASAVQTEVARANLIATLIEATSKPQAGSASL